VSRRTKTFAALAGVATVALSAGLRLVNGRRRDGEPPLVRGHLPYVGAALPFGRDATAFLQRCRREHGDIFTVFIAGRRMTFVCDPLSYEGVLRCPALQFEPIADQVMERAFDFPHIRDDIDVDATDVAARKHLRGHDLADLSGRMSAEVLRVLDDMQHTRLRGDSGELDLFRFVWDVIFEAATEVIFGTGKVCPHAAKAFQDFDEQFPALVAGLPKVLTRKGHAGLESLVEPFADLGEGSSAWMQTREPLIRDLDVAKRGRSQSAVLWAVHANTIPTSFWTLAHILCDPAATAAVVAEIDQTLGDAADEPLSRTQLDQLPVIESAASEALRLAAGSLTVRRATEAVTIETRGGAWSIRQGDDVCLAPQLTHYDPAVFEDPERFRYDRFLADDAGRARFEVEGERAAFAFMPFGAGKHTCPGRFFAINEVKVLITCLFRRLHFAPITGPLPGFDHRRAGLGIYPPTGDVRVRWTRRAAAPQA
jgi:cytochrome P450